jgi:hypothetical protein
MRIRSETLCHPVSRGRMMPERQSEPNFRIQTGYQVIEHFLLRLYRFLLPASLRKRIPQDFKDGLLVSFSLVSRRDLRAMRLRRAARVAGRTGDQARAVRLWQDLAVQSSASNTQLHDGTLARIAAQASDMPAAQLTPDDLDSLDDHVLDVVLRDGEARFDSDAQRKARYARTELMRARLAHATVLHAQGRMRHFREQLCRAIEAIPDQRVFKNDPQVLGALRLYVEDALAEDGAVPRHLPARDKPLKIAICLDILKLSDVHTHTRVVFAICRNLMRLDPAIETHVIVTNERFVVTTPNINASFDPGRVTALLDQARAALPEYYGKRFFLHAFRSAGLSGLVETCKGIIAIDPDLLLFGGGHKGFFSNESRAVRHCLHAHFPTAFFFIQSNNEVDDRLDMIIARGPHPVLGDPGQAAIRVQPYPTITEARIETVVQPGRRKQKIIISAMTGVRMDLRLAEQSTADMRAFLSLLDRNPGAVWHFVGASDPDAVLRKNPLLAARVKSGQVVVHPVLPLDAFTTLVGRAALFLHLPGFTGGSGGAGVARRAGVPILTFRHSDVSGRQPAGTVFDKGDSAGFAELAHRLLNDPDLWEDIVREQFTHMRWILEHSAQGFYDCLCEAHRIGTARMAARTDQAPAPLALPLRPGA